MNGVKSGGKEDRENVTCGRRIGTTTTKDNFCGAKQPKAVRCAEVPMEECQNLFVPIDIRTGKELEKRFIDVQ